MAESPDPDPKPYDGPIVAAATYARPVDAHFAQMALKEQGVPAFVEGENAALLREAPEGARLMVRGEDLALARAILEGRSAEEIEAAASARSREPAAAPACPTCAGEDLVVRRVAGWREVACVAAGAVEAIVRRRLPFASLGVLLFLVVAFPSRRLYCRGCGESWRSGTPAG